MGIPMRIAHQKGENFYFGPDIEISEGVHSHRSAHGNHGDGVYQCLYIVLRERGHSAKAAAELSRHLVNPKRKKIYYTGTIKLPVSPIEKAKKTLGQYFYNNPIYKPRKGPMR